MNQEVGAEEEAQPLGPCPACSSEIAPEDITIKCDWCGLQLHERCEPRLKTCPRCKRYLPTAKARALATDRRYTAILVAFPFVVIEAIIAIYSWLNHPGTFSVPDIENWLSLGLIVNVILLIATLISMGAVAKRGEGIKESKGEAA